ncbi:MAG: DNA-methyltransferase [Candidatus Nanopelagicaceae bacterium]
MESIIMQGDCLELMRQIPDGSVDMVLCDLPYGTTACAWDAVIPFDRLWAEYRRVTKSNAAIVLTASQPFTTTLAASNLREFKYQWVWQKQRPSNPQLAKLQPLKVHEDVLVFARGKIGYAPQGLVEIPESKRKVHKPETNSLGHCSRKPYVQTHTGYPKSIISFPSERGLHPTQKPVALMEYLILTYTNRGDTVLDNCMGSGTTGVACANTGRQFIGIEMDSEYFQIAKARIEGAKAG